MLLRLCKNTLDTYLLASAEIACDFCEDFFKQGVIVEHKIRIETSSENMLDEIGLLNVTAARLKSKEQIDEGSCGIWKCSAIVEIVSTFFDTQQLFHIERKLSNL